MKKFSLIFLVSTFLFLMLASSAQAATTWYVDASVSGPGSGTQGDPFKTINSAEAAAVSGDEIHVRQGIYSLTVYGSNNPDTIILKSGVYLRGGYYGSSWIQSTEASTTIISGEGSVRCMTGSGLTSATTIEYFTIENGYGGVYPSYGGGGGLRLESSSPTISNCTFTLNRAPSWGGGIYLTASFPTITNCTFESNSVGNGEGGGIYSNGGSPTITNCTFTLNSGYGSGIYGVSLTITNCTFTLNNGWVVYTVGNGSSPTIKNCLFTSNNGIGIRNDATNSTITNCTFTSNSWGIVNDGAAGHPNYPTITNSIIYGNTGGSIDNDPLAYPLIYSFPTVTYSCIQGGYSGTGNISVDPKFVNAPTDMHLLAESPCIDTGDGLASTEGLGWDQGYGSNPNSVYGDTGIVNMGYHYSGYSGFGSTNFRGTAVSTSEIQWSWSSASDAIGYYLHNDVNSLEGSTAGGVTNTLEAGLSANTQYTCHVHAYNATGTSDASNSYSRYTSIEAATGVEFSTITPNEIQARPAGTFSHYNSGSSGVITYNITQGTNSLWSNIYMGDWYPSYWSSTGLSPNHQYGFKANSRNGDGISREVTGTVNKYTMANVPGTPAIKSVTTSSEVITWTANGNPGTTTYEVAHSTGATWESIPIFPFHFYTGITWESIYTGTATTCTHSALGANTKNYYKIRAKNGDGVYTNYVTSTPTYEYTLANIPGTPEVIGDWDAQNGYHTHITIDPNGNSDDTKYAIKSINPFGWLDGSGAADTMNTTWKTKADWETDDVNAHISLNVSTTYYYQVKAKNGDNIETSPSPSGNGTTPSGPGSVPSAPIGLVTTGNTTNSAYSTWGVPAGSPTSYTISYGIDTGASSIGITTETAPAHAHSWTGLSSATKYYWKVLATNTYGPGAYSSIASFETLSLLPSAPPLVTVEAPNGGEFLTGGVTYEIRWSATDESGIKSNGITLRYSTDSGSNWNLINSSLPNTRIYSWEAAKVNSTNCRVSVEAEDLDGNIGADMSDSDFTISTEGVSAMAPTIEAVWINGIRFRSGDIISSNVSLDAVISSEGGVDPASIVLKVDNVPIAPPLSLVSGTPTYGTWRGIFTITPGPQQVHIFTFHLVDVAANASDITMEARVISGGVQVVGVVYNYPNPFSPMSGGATNIQYALSRDAMISIIIYDITGHEVKRMKFSAGTNGGRGGTNQVSWNGQSMSGEIVGNGMYIYKIISGDRVVGSSKVVIMD